MESMRKEWFKFVAVIRKRLTRKRKTPVSHRDAMKEAALLWPKEKTKLLNRKKREERKAAKEKAKCVKNTQPAPTENTPAQ